MLDRLRPKSWLDGLGLVILTVCAVGFIVLIVSRPIDTSSAGDFYLGVGSRVALLFLSLSGYLIRRVARKESPFGDRRKR